MWVIIQLRDRNETPLFEEDDEYDGKIYDGFKTRKEAEEQAKIWRWCNKLTGEDYRYIVEREDRL